MEQFEPISAASVKERLQQQSVIIIDIRDEASFVADHIADAIHVTSHNIRDFIDSSDPDTAVVVYCYHGHASQHAAQLLIDQGFDEVYSLTGGYTAWQQVM